MKTRIVFRSARIFDGESEVLRTNENVFVEGGVISEISDRPPSDGDEVVDCGGRVLMPGLIDAHVHVYAAGLNIARVVQSPVSYLAHFAAQFLRSSLDRGFTTLRDVGGADIGLALAIKDGLLDRVPRLFYGGRVISQTGGHGDFRPGDHSLETGHYCGCSLPRRPVGGDCGWCRRGPQSGAGRASSWCLTYQDHGIRRSCVA